MKLSPLLLTLLLPLPGHAEGLSGTWHGTYGYGTAGERPVEFTLRLCREGNTLQGSISEPNTFGDNSSDVLKARVRGQLQGRRVTFRKDYDGTAGAKHSVDYDGALDGNRVAGKWKIPPDAEGPFEMELLASGTAADAGCPPDTVDEIRMR